MCKKKSFWLLIMGGIFVLLFTLQVSSIFAQKEEGKEPYVIGAVFAITGPNSMLGDPEKKTVDMLVEEINGKGGINGHPVKVIVYDTEGDATNCKNKVKRLIEVDKVDVIIGPTLSGTSLAVKDDINNAGMPFISCAASIKITEPVTKWVFKTAQSDVLAVNKIIEFAKAKKIDKVAIITVSNAFGESGKEMLENLLPKSKIEIVTKEAYGPNDTDMTAQLTKINGTTAQAVICWGTNPGPAIVAKNMKQLGMKQLLIQSHGVASKKFIELAGDAANGVVLPAGKLIVAAQLPDSDPQKATLVDYTKKYESKYNSSISTFGGHAWDAFMIAVKAMEKAGKDKEKIRTEIENTKNFVGITGIFNMSPIEHNGLTIGSFVMVEIQNGNWTLAK